MSCDIGEVTESLENEQRLFSKLSVASPMLQLRKETVFLHRKILVNNIELLVIVRAIHYHKNL